MTYLLVSISVLGLLIAVTGLLAFWLFDDATDVFDDLNDAYLQAVIDRSLAEQRIAELEAELGSSENRRYEL